VIQVNDEERERELIEMLNLCIAVWEGADGRETLGHLVARWDVSPHSARLLLVAFEAGMLAGHDISLVPVPN
jgi:hypothetical protein